MNIGIVCYPTFGGSGVVATELGKQLALLGNQVHFISYQQPVRLDVFYPNIYYHEISTYNYALFEGVTPYESNLTSKLVDVVLNEKIDILHVHYAIPHASVAYLVKQILKTKGKNLPIITTLHGTDITLIGKDKSFSPIVEFSINQSDAITTVSNHLKEETYKNFNITKNIDVIYNFIDCSKINNLKIKDCLKSIVKDEEKIITHVSNFRKVKRIDDIVLGFEIIKNQIPAKLLLVGDGPERIKIENLVREKNLQNDVKFLGKQENIYNIYSLSDLFILASDHESFGLSALEAMSCGVPIITTNTGGLKELNIDSKTGFIFNVGDFNKMAEHCLYILKNKEIHIEFKKNSINRAKEFDTSIIIPKYLEVYNRFNLN